MAPGLVDDAATQRALVAHAGVRAIIDLWDRLDVALFGIGGPAWSAAVGRRGRSRRQLEPARRRRRGPRRAVRPRRPVRLPGAARAGHRLRRPAARPRPGRHRRRRRARARSGRSSARCGPGVVRTLVTDVATAEAVVALDDATPRRAGRPGRDDASASRPSSASTSARPRSRPASSPSTAGCSALARSGYGLDVGGRPRLGRAGPGRVVVGGGQRGPGAARRPTLAEVVAIGVDGHGPTLAAVDARGEATRPAITFLDTRADRRGRRAGRRDRRPRLGARRPAGRAVGRAPRTARSPRPPAGTSRPGSGSRSG